MQVYLYIHVLKQIAFKIVICFTQNMVKNVSLMFQNITCQNPIKSSCHMISEEVMSVCDATQQKILSANLCCLGKTMTFTILKTWSPWKTSCAVWSEPLTDTSRHIASHKVILCWQTQIKSNERKYQAQYLNFVKPWNSRRHWKYLCP